MIEFKYSRGRLVDSLDFILEEIKEFENDYENFTKDDYLEDRKKQKLLEKTVENILMALIEICGTISSNEGKEIKNYSEAISFCARKFGFSKEEEEKISKLAIQRNRLAHRYLNFKWEAIKAFKESKPIVLSLLKKISKEI